MKILKNYEQELKLRGLSKDTLNAYTYANEKFLEFIKKDPKEVSSNDVKRYINHLLDKNQKPKTINLTIAALKSYYSEYRGRKFFKNIRRVKLENKMPNVLSKQELKDMINLTDNQKHKLIIKCLYSTGIRVGELVKIKTEDLDLENGFLRVISGKGKKDRLTIISKELCSEIRLFIKEDQIYLFPNRKGNCLTRRAIQVIINKAAKKANIKRNIYPHALRASFATHLYEKGTQLQKIQKLMGHSDWKTTLGYAKSVRVDIKDVENPLDSLNS